MLPLLPGKCDYWMVGLLDRVEDEPSSASLHTDTHTIWVGLCSLGNLLRWFSWKNSFRKFKIWYFACTLKLHPCHSLMVIPATKDYHPQKWITTHLQPQTEVTCLTTSNYTLAQQALERFLEWCTESRHQCNLSKLSLFKLLLSFIWYIVLKLQNTSKLWKGKPQIAEQRSKFSWYSTKTASRISKYGCTVRLEQCQPLLTLYKCYTRGIMTPWTSSHLRN